MKFLIKSYLLPHWQATPVNVDIILGLRPTSGFYNDGVLLEKHSLIQVTCRTIPLNAPGLQSIGLRISEFELLSTTDSTVKDVRYRCAFYDPNSLKMIQKWNMMDRFRLSHELGTPIDTGDEARRVVSWDDIFLDNRNLRRE